MNIKCIMLLACLSGIVVLPETQAIPLRNSPRPNQQRNPVPQSRRPVVPSSPQLLPRPIPTSRPSTPVSSVKTTTIPIASKRVETFAKKLRDDMDKQERVLNVFISTIKQKHQQSQLKLSRVKIILKGLKDEIANATKYANQYQTEVNDQSKQEKLIMDEYEKSHKMFSDERKNIEFEKKFLEEIIKYIQLRKTQKC